MVEGCTGVVLGIVYGERAIPVALGSLNPVSYPIVAPCVKYCRILTLIIAIIVTLITSHIPVSLTFNTNCFRQKLLKLEVDCDSDAIRATVVQLGNPPAFCHLNRFV